MNNIERVKLFLCFAAITPIMGCLPETNVIDETTPTPTPAQAIVVPYFDYGTVSKAEVYFDVNDDNTASDEEYLGTTNNSGQFESEELLDLINSNPQVSIMVKMLAGESQVDSSLKGLYTIEKTVWMSYDLEFLSNSYSTNSTSDLTVHVNAVSTWAQSLMNHEDYLYDYSEAVDLVNDSMKYVDNVSLSDPDYDDYYFASYTSGLETGALSSDEFCCVSIYVPEFEIVGTQISWSYDEILERGDEPDPYYPPVFEYDPDGNLIIEIPTDPSDEDPVNGDYDGRYSGDGEFINENGETPSTQLVTVVISRANTNSPFAYAEVEGKLAIAYTRTQEGNPSVSQMSVNFDSMTLGEVSVNNFPFAGSIEHCYESGSCYEEKEWRNAIREIYAFDSWGDEAILSVGGPTTGAYTLSGESWSNWYDTDELTVWTECKDRGGVVHCTDYDSHFNYVNTYYQGVMYGPSGFYDYLQYGNAKDDTVTFRNALRVQQGYSASVGEEGDFDLIGTMPVNMMNTFRMRGNSNADLMGWFNERDDDVRGLAIKKDGNWQALGDSDYDKMNAMYSNDVIEPKVSATTFVNGLGYYVASAEVTIEYQYDDNWQLYIDGYTLNTRKYDTEDSIWTTSWIKFEADEKPVSVDVGVFNDGSSITALCTHDQKMTLLRWSEAMSVPGIGVLERHDTDESCTDLEILESTPLENADESLILINGSTVYGLDSAGGYIKLTTENTVTDNPKWFSHEDGWILTGSNNKVLLFEK